MNGEALRVEVCRSAEGLLRLGPALDALNLASRRPSPFNGAFLLHAFAVHEEFPAPGLEPLLLLAWEGEALTGYLPLRRFRERLLGCWTTRLGVLVQYEHDRPQAVARAGDEPRCCQAFYRHLMEREPGWSLLELANQDDASGLLPPPGARWPGFRARLRPGWTNATIPLPWPDLAAYWQGALSSNGRSNVGRAVRRLLSAGAVEFVSSADPAARLPLLDLYVDVEGRSWKAEQAAHTARSATRLALYRALCGPASPLGVGFHLVLLDGLPIAAMLTMEQGGVAYWKNLAYDGAFGRLAPGNLLLLLGVREALRRGCREVNFLNRFAAYKARWGAVITETRTVQVFRVGGLPDLKARAGDLRRSLLGAGGAAPEEDHGPAEVRAGGEAPLPERTSERAQAARTLDALAAAGAQVTRLSGDGLLRALPFKPKGAG